MERLTQIDWVVLDEEYNGYNGEPREGKVTDTLREAGIGWFGNYDTLEHLWRDCVQESEELLLQSWNEETSN